MASIATFAFSAALYRLRCPDIIFLLVTSLSIQLFYLIPLSRILVPVYPGRLTDFYQITHDTSYLTQSEAIADANTATNVDDQGILYEQNCEATESCGDDGPQFKGIFIKNLSYLYQSDHKQAYKDFILKNANAIWSHNRDRWNHLGLHWGCLRLFLHRYNLERASILK